MSARPRQTRIVIANEELFRDDVDAFIRQAFQDVQIKHMDDGSPLFWESIQRTGIYPWPIEREVLDDVGCDRKIIRIVERRS